MTATGYGPLPTATHAAPRTSNHWQVAFIITVGLLALALVGAGVKIVQDAQAATRLNASISTLEADKADLETDLSDVQSDLRSAESENGVLQGRVDQASTTIAKYLLCTKGLLKSNEALAGGGLFGAYTALDALKDVKSDCVYAMKHSQIAKSEFA